MPLPVPPESPEFLILARLCLHGPQERADLSRLLWHDEDPEEAIRLLDEALDRLRDLAGPDAIWADEEGVEVDPGRVTADVERFREALAGGRPRDALAYYRGPFLQELEFPDRPEVDRWVAETRRTLAGLARQARDQVPWGDDEPEDLWPRLVREIRSRPWVHVALLYLGFAWGSFEVALRLVDAGFLGNSVVPFVLAFHALGFPLAVTATWLLAVGQRKEGVGGLSSVLGRSGLRAVHLLTFFAVLAIGSGLAWIALQWGADGAVIGALQAELPEEKHLAVLPFHVAGGDAVVRDFADGLGEAVASQLTGVEGLKGTVSVVSSADIRARGVRGPTEAREVFGVNLAVTGEVRATGDSIRVTVNLVDAVRGRQFDSFVLSESAANLNRLQKGILDGLHGLLNLELRSSDETRLASGRTESAQAYGLQVRARTYLQRYEREENLDRALELFREALTHDPGYVLALAGIGEAHRRKYDLNQDPAELERARQAVLAALDSDEEVAQVHVTMGLIEMAHGEYEAAAGQFQRALDLEPFSVDALLGLGQAYRRLGQPSEAEERYLRAQRVRAGDWRLHNGLGVLYQTLGRFEEAAAEFERVVELQPDNARGWSNLAAMYYYQGRMEEAADGFERAISIDPNPDYLSNLATVYFLYLQDYERAAELYEEILAEDPGNYEVWRNLGSAYSYIPGAEARARAAYRSALERAGAIYQLNPRDSGVLLTMAVSHAHLGQPDRARPLVRRALDLEPENVHVLFEAGNIYERLGERDEAIRLIEEAVDRGYSWEVVERSPGLADLRADPRFQAPAPGGGEVEHEGYDDT